MVFPVRLPKNRLFFSRYDYLSSPGSMGGKNVSSKKITTLSCWSFLSRLFCFSTRVFGEGQGYPPSCPTRLTERDLDGGSYRPYR